MRFVLFYHSLVSDWNHGNAHFLRGIVRELTRLRQEVAVYEPRNGWSRTNLEQTGGPEALSAFHDVFPGMVPVLYDRETLDLERALHDADVVLVHEWTDPELVAAVGRKRKRGGRFLLLFHDTHHRLALQPSEKAKYDLDGYDGVLAFGEALREIYLRKGWSRRVWTWHEAADAVLFRPLTDQAPQGDLVWIGNWGDDERAAELREFLLGPIGKLGLKAHLYGVRYPREALEAVRSSGAQYCGWLPNYRAPEVFGRFGVTVHVPRRPYVQALPGIPTIRVFETLACGIPLVCSPWDDSEGLFRRGRDYLLASDGEEMKRQLHRVLNDRDLATSLSRMGRETILKRHTCRHRVEELIEICSSLGLKVPASLETVKTEAQEVV